MNIARAFSYTREMERQRDEWRERVRQLEAEQKMFVDAIARNAGKLEVFNRPDPQKPSQVPLAAFGPTMSAQRQKAKEEEAVILKRAAQARRNNGQPIEIPEIS